jgi:hypothetical protein
MHGVRRGIVAGLVTLLLPMTLLRPCCVPGAMAMTDGSCCTQPTACIGAGMVVGLLLATTLPMRRGTWEAAAGMALGVLAVASLKCAALLFGEALGLLGGLACGVLVVGAAKALLDRRRATS